MKGIGHFPIVTQGSLSLTLVNIESNRYLLCTFYEQSQGLIHMLNLVMYY